MVQEKAISVTQLATYIKQIFQAEEMLFDISVVGEVSGIKNVRGIAYFDLKDENALISCVCFDGENCIDILNGDRVVVKGTPGFYVKGGKLNFNVRKITPTGKGDLFLNFLKLKEKLEKEGLFSTEHKKNLPKDVKKIGVITSETGAVIQDIINVATRRNNAINIVLYPAKVQGSGAEVEIIKGLDFFENFDIDVVIIARGGGSMEDLNCFNSEILARRVYDFSKPIISAIGHETDFTILDFVADLRAPTPSASAELAVENISIKYDLFKRQVSKLYSLLENQIMEKNALLVKYRTKILRNMESFLNDNKYWLGVVSAKLEKLNPEVIMKLGYSKILKNGKVIISKNNLLKGDIIDIAFSDGNVKGEVK